MLAVVGVASAATTDLLLRTEGFALLAASAFLWSVRDGTANLDRLEVALDDDRLVADAGLLLPAALAHHLGLRESR